MRVLGSRARGPPSSGAFDHATNTGHVPEVDGDYADAIKNRKARVHLLSHETSGGMLPYAAMRLRRLARAAAALGNDPTDYSISYSTRRAATSRTIPSGSARRACSTARAGWVLKGVAKMRAARRAAATAA